MPSNKADEPSALDAADVLIRHIFKTLGGARVGTVVVYNPLDRTANVQPVRRRKARGAVFDEPLVVQAPVGWWRFGQMVLAGELEPGDEVLLLTMEREIRPWYIGGLPHDPESPRTHNHTDTIVLPWISALTRPIVAQLPGSFYIGREDATASITIPMAKVPPSLAGLPGQIIIDGIPAGIKAGAAAVSPVVSFVPYAAAWATLTTALGSIATALGLVPPPVDLATALVAIAANTTAILGMITAFGVFAATVAGQATIKFLAE